MFKVLHIVPAFAVLWISAVICEDCLYQLQTWGGPNPNVFYYCNQTTNQSQEVECPPGRGFVSNATSTGCIPWEDWSDNCIDKVDVSTITCEGQTFLQPQAIPNPGSFYLCIAQNATPVELSCPDGRGFFSRNNYLGCYPWAMWRNITGCVND